MSGTEALQSERFAAVDYVKAFAIVAVVFTHSVLSPARGLHTPWDDLLGRGWVSYHVPAFLVASGFLYYRDEGIGWRKVAERLLRVLVPYLVASLVALALGVVPTKEPDFLVRLVTGNTQGHYYYVVLIAAYVPLIWVFSRSKPIWLWLLLGLLLLYPVASYEWSVLKFSETHVARLRNPVYPAVYFVAGWVLRMALPELRRIVVALGDARFWGTLALAAAAGIVFYFEGPLRGGGWQAYLGNRMIYTASVLTLICALSSTLSRIMPESRRPPGWIGFLSRSSYTIYLYHFFFIYPVRSATLQWPPLERIFTIAAVAMVGGCLLAWVSGRVLGPRSRWIFG